MKEFGIIFQRKVKRDGFTLAEVLITLAIIGIVVAMTIPSLIANHRDKVTVTKLRKTKAVTEQMLRTMTAVDGVDRFSKTSLWAVKDENNCSPSYVYQSCKNFYNAFKNYAKVEIDTSRRKYAYLFEPNAASWTLPGNIVLPDGAMLSEFFLYDFPKVKTEAECDIIQKLGGNICSMIGWVYIDVDGLNGVNVLGRDIFRYYISDDGRLYADYGKDYALYSVQTPLPRNTSYWRNYPMRCGTPGKKDTVEKLAYGSGCPARIEENDWKIDY